MRVVPRAWWFAIPTLLAAIPALVLAWWVALVCVALAVGVLVFFRDPQRTPPDSGIVAPADGRVSVLRTEDDGRVRVGVFMHVTDVHVNRAPVGGTVTAIEHRPGAHRPAFSKGSDRNERARLRIEGDRSIAVELIAGAFARRITPYPDEGDRVDRGERIGHIAFGSRADVLLPREIAREDVVVQPGDRVRAGESRIVAD